MSLIRFLLNNGRSQHFSQEEHGENFEDMADRFHKIHGTQVVSRETLTKKTMQLTSISTQSATVETADGRTVVITEGLPVQILPQDIQVEPTVETPEVVAPAPEVPAEAPVEVPEADATPEVATPASIV